MNLCMYCNNNEICGAYAKHGSMCVCSEYERRRVNYEIN